MTTEGSGTIGGERVEVGSGVIGAGGVSIPNAPGLGVHVDGAGSGIGGWIALTLGALGVGLLLVLISGTVCARSAARSASARAEPSWWGSSPSSACPLSSWCLLISVIGIPVALLLIPLVPLFSLYGMFALALVVGERLLVHVRPPSGQGCVGDGGRRTPHQP